MFTLQKGTGKPRQISPALTRNQLIVQCNHYEFYDFKKWPEKFIAINSDKNNVTLDQTKLTRIDLQHFNTGVPAGNGFPPIEKAAHYSLQTNGKNSITIGNVWIDRKVLQSLKTQQAWGCLRKTWIGWLVNTRQDLASTSNNPRPMYNYIIKMDQTKKK